MSILVRVYGLCINSKNELLISHERYGQHQMIKFPGGGLEYGEGTKDCLIREFKEELGLDIEVGDHFYTTDFFQKSAYHERAQILSIYYLVKILSPTENLSAIDEHVERIEFVPIDRLSKNYVSLPIDQLVLGHLLEKLGL